MTSVLRPENECATDLPLTLPTLAPPAALTIRTVRDAAARTPRIPWRTRLVPRHALAMGDGTSALVAGTLVLTSPGSGPAPLALGVVVAVVWVSLLGFARSYESRATSFDLEDLRRVVRAGIGLSAALLVLSIVFDVREESSGLVATATTVTSAGIALRLLGSLARRMSRQPARIRVVVAGDAGDVACLLAELRADRHHAFEPAAACVPSADAVTGLDLPVTVGFESLADAVSAHDAGAVILVPGRQLDPATVRRLGWLLEPSGAELYVASGLVDVATSRATVRHVGSLPLLPVRASDLHGARRVVKGAWVRSTALVALLILAPLLLLLALLVRSTSEGPAFFRQTRIGMDGRPFTMFKFRTMGLDAEQRRVDVLVQSHADGVLFKIRNDPRVTRVGRVLRTYSLDELPQLINVVRGEMALVGPRPPLVEEVAQYEPDERRRLAVRPGITGLWQVSGRSDLSWQETVRLDLRYVDNWSLALDLLILCRTVRAVLGHNGAY